MTRLKAKLPALIAFHCNCHIATLIANHACSESPKRQRTIDEFQTFVECKPNKLLKAAQTKWLSLEACVNQLLEQYEALLSYFRSTEERQITVQRIKSDLEKPTSKLYLMFLSDALPLLMQIQGPLCTFILGCPIVLCTL